MSAQEPWNATWCVRDARNAALTPGHKAVLFALASRIQAPEEEAWPSVPTLAADAGYETAQCKVITGELHRWGVLTWRPKPMPTGRVNAYTIHFDRLAQVEPYDAQARRQRPAPSRDRMEHHPMVGGSDGAPSHGSDGAPSDGWDGAPSTKIPSGRDQGKTQDAPASAPSTEPSTDPEPAPVTARAATSEAPASRPTLLDVGSPVAAPKAKKPKAKKAKPAKSKAAKVDLDPETLNAEERAAYDAIRSSDLIATTVPYAAQTARDLVETRALGVDVAREIRKANVWKRNRGAKRPDGAAFLANWIGKQEATAGAPATTSGTATPNRTRVAAPPPSPLA